MPVPQVVRGSQWTVSGTSPSRWGLVIHTAEGPSFLVREDPQARVGEAIRVGSVCGDWCSVFFGGRRLQARLLGAGRAAAARPGGEARNGDADQGRGEAEA